MTTPPPKAVPAPTAQLGALSLFANWINAWRRKALIRSTAKTGERGERLAADLLQRLGYTVVARNWRDPLDRRDELDLVCRDGEILVFIEVKTRAATALVSGYYTVNQRKKKVVRRAATSYLRSLQPRPRFFRFDVVEVTVSADDSAEVRHFENIALFPKHFRP